MKTLHKTLTVAALVSMAAVAGVSVAQTNVPNSNSPGDSTQANPGGTTSRTDSSMSTNTQGRRDRTAATTSPADPAAARADDRAVNDVNGKANGSSDGNGTREPHVSGGTNASAMGSNGMSDSTSNSTSNNNAAGSSTSDSTTGSTGSTRNTRTPRADRN